MKKKVDYFGIIVWFLGVLILSYFVLSYIDDSQTASAWCGSRTSKYNNLNDFDTTYTENWGWYCANYVFDCEGIKNYKTGCKVIGISDKTQVPNNYLEYMEDIP